MAGTKRLAVGGPWHGQIIEPSNDTYRSLAVNRSEFVYVPRSLPFPTVAGVLAPMPVLVCDGYEAPTFVDVLDALVSAVWSADEVTEFIKRAPTSPILEVAQPALPALGATGLVGADGEPL